MFPHTRFLSLFSLNHPRPNPSLGVAQCAVGLHHHRLLSFGAWLKRESAPCGEDCNFCFQDGKTHPEARSWALTKGLECIPGSVIMRAKCDILKSEAYGFLAAFSSLLKCSGQNSSG